LSGGTGASGAGEGREVFGTRLGFVLAAVGSAVGLGNIWRFPYQTAEGGGAAFVIAYLIMTFMIGVPIMLAEFAVGRRTRLSPVGALRSIGGRAWVPLGILFVVTSLLILAYLSVITGWAIRYALDAALFGFSTGAGDRFTRISTGGPAIGFHLVSITLTIGIVLLGVRRGIERASLLMMPTLFLLLIGLAIWASTLPNAAAGYRFYLAPSLAEVLDPAVLQGAAAQAFYSLSVGMGIMITYASYYSREENLNREAAVIALADFSVAFIAGLVVFPIVFALGLSEEVGESAVGALFISLPEAFLRMGSVGRIVGATFFMTLVVAAITSAVSLLEVVAAVLMDEMRLARRQATLLAGCAAGVVGVAPAVSIATLGVMDQLVAELFTVLGVLGVAILAGWVMKAPEEELRLGASPLFQRIIPLAVFLLRYVAPLLVGWIAWISLRGSLAALFGGQ
jgi:NSS family neurotransmitter:Na+ symporter